MPLTLFIKTKDTVHPEWTVASYKDTVPSVTPLSLSNHSLKLVGKTHQYNH
jgi:hypothetical protein